MRDKFERIRVRAELAITCMGDQFKRTQVYIELMMACMGDRFERIQVCTELTATFVETGLMGLPLDKPRARHLRDVN